MDSYRRSYMPPEISARFKRRTATSALFPFARLGFGHPDDVGRSYELADAVFDELLGDRGAALADEIYHLAVARQVTTTGAISQRNRLTVPPCSSGPPRTPRPSWWKWAAI